jgi:hypothetical protein
MSIESFPRGDLGVNGDKFLEPIKLAKKIDLKIATKPKSE